MEIYGTIISLGPVLHSYQRGRDMNIKRFIKAEVDFYRKECNFVNDEIDVFEMRSRGIPLERIAELKGYTSDGIRKISRDVNNKIIKVQHFYGTF